MLPIKYNFILPFTSGSRRRVQSLTCYNTLGRFMDSGKVILIIDDDPEVQDLVMMFLKLRGYQGHLAKNGEEGVRIAREVRPHLILMDIMMPKMDGYEACRQIRKQNKWAKLPVIALTAKAMMDDREKCIEAGANDYITKPVDMDRLIALMQLWLDK